MMKTAVLLFLAVGAITVEGHFWDKILGRSEPTGGPGAGPGSRPGAGPGAGPGVSPGSRPGAGPGVSPGSRPGASPGVSPGAGPGVSPGSHPGASPGVSPGAGQPNSLVQVVMASTPTESSDTGFRLEDAFYPGTGTLTFMESRPSFSSTDCQATVIQRLGRVIEKQDQQLHLLLQLVAKTMS
ncbi:transcript variant X1 [Nothobranchius furzeri]|uniref:Transcript variant X1 n=1 Tax=Nothobranchius furzeri TaxID=105023 RepID=A0A9D2XRJ6_NOTFU|nr:transcript variant X1 [Nothobranchius furzeri]